MVVEVRTKGKREGTPTKAVLLLHTNVNACSMFHDEFLQYTELPKKIIYAEKDAHVTAESECGNGCISTQFFKRSFFFFFVTLPRRSECSIKMLPEGISVVDLKSIILNPN